MHSSDLCVTYVVWRVRLGRVDVIGNFDELVLEVLRFGDVQVVVQSFGTEFIYPATDA